MRIMSQENLLKFCEVITNTVFKLIGKSQAKVLCLDRKNVVLRVELRLVIVFPFLVITGRILIFLTHQNSRCVVWNYSSNTRIIDSSKRASILVKVSSHLLNYFLQILEHCKNIPLKEIWILRRVKTPIFSPICTQRVYLQILSLESYQVVFLKQ
jgi:hypothetical protein